MTFVMQAMNERALKMTKAIKIELTEKEAEFLVECLDLAGHHFLLKKLDKNKAPDVRDQAKWKAKDVDKLWHKVVDLMKGH
jgi:hypothetical protein